MQVVIKGVDCCCQTCSQFVYIFAGFNPVWNEVLRFTISVPELALVRFVVEDHDSTTSNDFIGQFTLPFTSLKEGYRHVHLLSKDAASLSPATLFIRVRIKSV
ncbi:1-phosphatidylinositol 4,5-bisphosphate phosphodiesterase delta-3-like [Mustelus asterias]